MTNLYFQIQTTLSFADYLRFTWHCTARRCWWLLGLLFIGLVTNLLYPLLPSHDRRDTLASYAEAFPVILLVAAFLLAIPGAIYFEARRKWARAFELHKQKTYRFSDDGISVQGASGAASVLWQNFVAAETVGNMLILLATSQGLYHVFPTAAFRDATEVQQFKDFLRWKVRDCRRPR